MPPPYSYYFHLRVIRVEKEAPDIWHGDFWGLGLAQETYDVRFLEAHHLEKGNLYKLITQPEMANDSNAISPLMPSLTLQTTAILRTNSQGTVEQTLFAIMCVWIDGMLTMLYPKQ